MARNTRIYTDIDAAFGAHPISGDLVIRTDERAVKFAVKALVLTVNYERAFHPEIGTPVKHLLFENFDDVTVILLKESIANVISNYEPRVDLLDVFVDPKYDNNAIDITITFALKNTNKPLEVNVTLERTR
jgi:phage baseplate assembly protein W